MPRTVLAFASIGILVLLCAPLASGDGSRAAYERAAAMEKRVRGKVLNESLALTWIAPEQAVYRRELPGGGWRWMLVDAAADKRSEAFDHEKVARRLGRVVGRTVQADGIRVTPLGAKDGTLQVLYEARAIGIDLEKGTCEELDLEEVDFLRLRRVTATRSDNGGPDTAILFVNRTEGPVKLVWLDHEGEPHGYATVPPGTSHGQHTYEGHVWRVEDEAGRALGTWRAKKRIGVAVVAAREPRTPAPRTSEPQTPEVRRPRRKRGTSPDGRFRVFAREHDVFLEEVSSGTERRLTDDGTAEDAYVGRWSWSPTSRTVMVVRERPAQEHRVYAVDSVPKDRLEPRLRSWNYLKAGDRIAVPRPHLFDVASGKRIDLPEDLFDMPWAISHFSWSDDGKRFRFLYNQRGHQVLRFLELDAGRRRVQTILEETSETFIDYSQKTFLERIPDTDDWIWMSERSGTNHLYRVNAETKETRPITEGPWVVRRVRKSKARSGGLLFEAMGVDPDQDPYHVHIGRVDLDGVGRNGERLVWLTEGDGTHDIEFSPGGAHYVDTWSRVDLAPVHELRRTEDGSLVTVLEEADWTALLAAGWRPPERFVAKGRDGTSDIWGVLYVPSTFDAAGSYPVVESIYAGPHGQFVPKGFRAWHGGQRTAELGFVVAKIDGMGTNWRSKAFHDVCWKNLADAGFPDRVLWLRAAAKDRPWMDLERVGIYGGSAGGQSAMRALLAHHDTYHVAVADCGCHDNRMDKIWWNEAWMGWPVGPHYEEQSNATQAHRLKGQLLLVVGEVDRNVDPASTMQVVSALIRADKDFDLLVIPGAGHGTADTPYGRRRRMDFLVRHLLGVEPRWE